MAHFIPHLSNNKHSDTSLTPSIVNDKMGRVKRIWYLSPMRAAKVRRACASVQSRQNLRFSLIHAVSQEEPSDRKPDPWPLSMAGHAQLKFVMTECSKTQIRLTGLKWSVKVYIIFFETYIPGNNFVISCGWLVL